MAWIKLEQNCSEVNESCLHSGNIQTALSQTTHSTPNWKCFC